VAACQAAAPAPAPRDAGGVEAAAETAAETAAEAATDASSGTCVAPCRAEEFCGASGACVSDVTQVAAGTGHTCALHRDGHVSCWGYGAFIAAGLPPLTPPVTVALPRPATAVAVGAEAACALLDDGGAACWGVFAGQLQPVQAIVREDGTRLSGITQLAGGTLAFCALNPAGAHCWGSNESAELGRPQGMTFAPTTALLVHPGPSKLLAASVAILVHDGQRQLCGWGANDAGIIPGARGVVDRPTCANDVPDVLALSGGDGHVCARRGGNRFSCWGSNSGGQLGTGDDSLLDVEMPGQMTTLPAEITTIAAGGYHTCILLADGAVHCFGNNDHAQVGLPSSAAIFSPRAITGFSRRVVALGSGAEANHTCAILDDGAAECWGLDDRGQLGQGPTSEVSTRNSPRPVAVRF
jgi:alpha-tubulin suppressor-like RCC1 family protein